MHSDRFSLPRLPVVAVPRPSNPSHQPVERPRERGHQLIVLLLLGVLEQALDRLSETQKSLVLLKDYEGYSYEEIGRITGLNESQVKVYLHRARIQLKNYLVKPENVV